MDSYGSDDATDPAAPEPQASMALRACIECGETRALSTELHPAIAFVRCRRCKIIGPSYEPGDLTDPKSRRELLKKIIRGWNSQHAIGHQLVLTSTTNKGSADMPSASPVPGGVHGR